MQPIANYTHDAAVAAIVTPAGHLAHDAHGGVTATSADLASAPAFHLDVMRFDPSTGPDHGRARSPAPRPKAASSSRTPAADRAGKLATNSGTPLLNTPAARL